MPFLPPTFFQSQDVTNLARALLGKVLISELDGKRSSVLITETEAYEGAIDRASHAHGMRRTARTESMFLPGGIAYVYLCYGIHHLFNVVTGPEGVPHAILIRAGEPLEGIPFMLERRGMNKLEKRLTAGPGSMSKALGITTALDRVPLSGSLIRIEDRGIIVKDSNVIAAPRIGVDYAGAHAAWPYRFYIKDSLWVSRK